MQDQITHSPDYAGSTVAKQKFKITSWSTYNKALINRGTLTFRLDDEVIQAWYTINAIESVHRQFRKLTKTKGAFPNENSLLKLLYLGLMNAQEKNGQCPSRAGI
ncbi:Mobile element protein [Pantoea sp. AS-PWVM4]|nr:Mobile element protein [Pantoea sp. AS-PWVM4]